MEEQIISRLLNDVSVSGLVSNRVFPGIRPQGSKLPAVVLNVIDGAPLYVYEGEVGLSEARLQVDCWGKTYTSAKNTARAVKDSLSAFVGTVGSQTFHFIYIDDERDLTESGSGQEEYPFRVSLDVIVFFNT